MLLEQLYKTDYLATGFNFVQDASTEKQPIRLVMTTQQGSSFDPNSFNLVIEVVGTGNHVGLNVRPSSNPGQKWNYDFDNMRLVTADGIEIKGASPQTLDKMRAIVQPVLYLSNR